MGHYPQTRALLDWCQTVGQQESDLEFLGMIFTAQADLADELDQPAVAARSEKTALRYKYTQSAPHRANISHFNLATYLQKSGADPRDVLAQRLAATLLSAATGERVAERIATLANSLRGLAAAQAQEVLPRDFPALCNTVEQVEGVRFREMVEDLLPAGTSGDDLLQAVLTQTFDLVEAASKPTSDAGSVAVAQVTPKRRGLAHTFAKLFGRH